MQNQKKTEKCICSGCGQVVKGEGLPIKDFLEVRKTWGFFSEMDGETHEFYLCEECYKKLSAQFVVPVKVMDINELL